MTDDDLIERCARAGFIAWNLHANSDDWRRASEDERDAYRRYTRAVLEAAAHQPPAQAPITAEDVLAAERVWWLSEGVTDASRAAFMADWLNRRGER